MKKKTLAWAIKNSAGEYYTNNNAPREHLKNEISVGDKIVRVEIKEVVRNK